MDFHRFNVPTGFAHKAEYQNVKDWMYLQSSLKFNDKIAPPKKRGLAVLPFFWGKNRPINGYSVHVCSKKKIERMYAWKLRVQFLQYHLATIKWTSTISIAVSNISPNTWEAKQPLNKSHRKVRWIHSFGSGSSCPQCPKTWRVTWRGSLPFQLT